jgi:hypothetical protein
MKALFYAASLSACVLVSCKSDAYAVTISAQNHADFVRLPTPSHGAFSSHTAGTVQTTGTVYFNEVGSVANVYRSPFENAASGNGAVYDASNGGWQLPGFDKLSYTSIEANSSATYTFTASAALSLLWGSPDSYNSIKFFSGPNGTGSLEGTIHGSDLATQTYGHDLVKLTLGGSIFQSIVLYSSGPAFEFANLHTTPLAGPTPSPTPLPAALPLFAGGLGVIGLLSRFRKRKSTATIAAA